MEETVEHCRNPSCDWISLHNLTGLQVVPKLRPNPELSGIGVILGFSITAYITLGLLILYYITVYDYHRKSTRGKVYTNSVDRDILAFVRERILAWSPSRRFEYAMEKAVLILSDTQLVTGLAILVSGYSRLNCGISTYHRQMLVYVAWFSSFSFLSAMTFLEGYFQTNHSLRFIRIFFMFSLGSFLVAALLPTGSHNWLNLLPDEGGFYPGLAAKCYFQQMGTDTYNPRGGPKVWSMVVSILVVGISYIHSGIRLFDPTAELTRNYFRAWPGSYLKRSLHFLERKSNLKGLRAAFWTLVFLLVFAGFTSARALYDIMESMLLEIIWLTFAIAWGTIKLYDIRASATFNANGDAMGANHEVLEEDLWSFGQTLPLALLLLPILCMAQAYLDNDAKAQDAAHKSDLAEKAAKIGNRTTPQTTELSSIHISNEAQDIGNEEETLDPRNLTSCSLTRRNYHPSLRITLTSTTGGCFPLSSHSSNPPPIPQRSPLRPTSPLPPFLKPRRSPLSIPSHPYQSFASHSWYKDHILLLILQILMVAVFALFLLTQLSNFLGLSVFLRNRLFLGWILGIIPSSCLIHLAVWYLVAWCAMSLGCERWLTEKWARDLDESVMGNDGGKEAWWKRLGRLRFGYVVYWVLRMLLVAALLVYTFLISVEIAGPEPLMFYV